MLEHVRELATINRVNVANQLEKIADRVRADLAAT